MPRRKKTPLIDTSTREVLAPDGIPPELRALGWRYRGRESAERIGPDGKVTAFVVVDIWPARTDIWPYDGWLAVWIGSSLIPRRNLRIYFRHAVEAMRAIEDAEGYGPLSRVWEDQEGAPIRDGWKHVVRRGRDVWYRVDQGVTPCVMVQLPVKAETGPCNLQYAAAVDGVFITNTGGGTRLFFDPVEAMQVAEEKAAYLDAKTANNAPITV